jgi:alpha-amylase/alpha-mannosidase (GH57 family)
LCGALCAALFLSAMGFSARAQNPIHVTYLWHMHQPIYYPYESVNQTDSAGRFNFSVRGVHDARTGAYGEWPKNAVQQGTDLPNAGVQVSFSGSLMENMDGLYGQGWRNHYRWGRNGLRTARNNPRLDLVGIAYHHSLMPLTTKEAMRMQVRLHKEAYKDVWDTGGGYSKGFWPPECAFDVNMIPALADEGIQWVIVDNGHFDRACQGYP